MMLKLLEYAKSNQELQICLLQGMYFEKLFYQVIYSGYYYADEMG